MQTAKLMAAPALRIRVAWHIRIAFHIRITWYILIVFDLRMRATFDPSMADHGQTAGDLAPFTPRADLDLPD